MTYATIPEDCIDSVTSQDGDRVLVERLATPRLAPKVTLNVNWHSQQQQHSTSDTHVPSTWKHGVKREDQAGAQDVTDHYIEADLQETGAYLFQHGCGRSTQYACTLERRTQKPLTKSKWVRTTFVFVTTWRRRRRRRWCLARNPAKPSSTWAPSNLLS